MQRSKLWRIALTGHKRLSVPLMTATLLSGCASASVGNDYCLLYEPIMSSSEDSDDTLRQIDRENVKWLAVCEGLEP